MDIGRTEGVRGPGRIEGKRVEKATAQPIQPAAAAADRVEISQVGRLVSDSMALPDVRLDRIAAVKAQIEAGTYQNDQKLIAAFEKFLDEMRGR